MKILRGPTGTLLCCVFLVGVNAVVCSNLWNAGYIDQLGSTEGPFLALSSWIARHWGDLRWFPLWFCGMPFERVYGPGLHWTVAGISTIAHISVLHSYRIATASLYCFGPVTLFWLCYRLIGSRGYALAVGVVYSLFSPAGLLSGIVRFDSGGVFWPRRFQALVQYGESPHIAALTLAPLVIWSFHEAIGAGRRRFAPLAAILFGAMIATNWTATVGLLMALAAYILAYASGIPKMRWVESAALVLVGYLLVSPLVPPSVVAAVPGNASDSDGTRFGLLPLACWCLLGLVLFALHFLLEKRGVAHKFRFPVYFFVISGFVTLTRLWFNIYVLPQPHRFQLEMEMAFVLLAILPFHAMWRRWTPRVQKSRVVLLVLFGIFQIGQYRAGAEFFTRPIAMEKTVEYRAAKWLEQNAPGQRVFAPGSISVWMNALVDTPQMVGCCDQSIPSPAHRLAFTTIYDGHAAGPRDAEDSILWLRAYGATVIGVPGPASSEFFKAFRNPRKFDGVLPVIWREDDTTLYRVPGDGSLAHVISREAQVWRQPRSGSDVDPIRPFVAALDDSSPSPSTLRWSNSHEAHIQANVNPGQVISVQVTYAPGWHAKANGAPVPLHSDGLGLIIAEPACHGPCSIDLVYDSPPESHYTAMAQLIAALLCLAALIPLRAGHGARQPNTAPQPVPARHPA